MTITRTGIAFALAPLIPTLYFLVQMQSTGHRFIIMTLFFSVLFSYLPTLLFGLPLMSYLKNNNKLNIVNVVILGAILGVVVFYVFGFVFSSMLNSTKSLVPGLSDILWGALLGISVALPLSLIAGFPFLSSTKNTI